MNFELTPEQKLLKDNVARFVRERYSLEARRKLADGEPGWSEENWRTMAELGWLALPFAEADGGLDGTAIDTMLLMEELGKGLVLEPYLASIVLGGGALRRGGSDALKQKLLPGVIDGTRRLAFAYAEEQARFDLDDVTTPVVHQPVQGRVVVHLVVDPALAEPEEAGRVLEPPQQEQEREQPDDDLEREVERGEDVLAQLDEHLDLLLHELPADLPEHHEAGGGGADRRSRAYGGLGQPAQGGPCQGLGG